MHTIFYIMCMSMSKETCFGNKFAKWTAGCVWLTIVAVCGCGGGSTPNDRTAEFDGSEQSKDSVYSVNEFDYSDTVSVRGVLYRYAFEFRNDKSLPVVTNSFGYRYYDNMVVLSIVKANAGNDEWRYEHTFTKESFRRLIPEGDYNGSCLLGFNFNFTKQDNHEAFHFIATVGDCDASGQFSYPMAVDITTGGEILLEQAAADDEGRPEVNLNEDPEDEGV